MRQSDVFRVLLVASLTVCGCDEATVLTVVNAAHHGTRVDGKLPNLGDPEEARVFTNDMGWTINLIEGFAVTSTAVIESCDGTQIVVGTPFGPFPEYWTEQDKNVVDFGYADLPKGTYCKLILEYGRYQANVASAADDQPFPIKDLMQVEGRTLFLAGYAEKPDGVGGTITQNFGLETDQTVQVPLDLSAAGVNGGPFKITGEENATPNLTVLKAYDALFQGVEFDKLDTAAFNASLPKRLTDSTSVIYGTTVY
jgi:hypothetical protein